MVIQFVPAQFFLESPSALVAWSITRNSSPAIPAKSSRWARVTDWLKPVWWAPPARIQAPAATLRLGRGTQTALATGSFESGASGWITSTSFTTMRKRLPISSRVALIAGPLGTLKTSRAGSFLPPIESGWISRLGFAAAIEAHTSSMCAPSTFGFFLAQIIGVIFHEGSPALQTGSHHFHGAHQRGGFPIAFRAKAVAIRHQALDRQAGQLRQAVQVFEGGGKGFKTAFFKEGPHANFDAGSFPQGGALAAIRAQPIRHSCSCRHIRPPDGRFLHP